MKEMENQTMARHLSNFHVYLQLLLTIVLINCALAFAFAFALFSVFFPHFA